MASAQRNLGMWVASRLPTLPKAWWLLRAKNNNKKIWEPPLPDAVCTKESWKNLLEELQLAAHISGAQEELSS